MINILCIDGRRRDGRHDGGRHNGGRHDGPSWRVVCQGLNRREDCMFLASHQSDRSETCSI